MNKFKLCAASRIDRLVPVPRRHSFPQVLPAALPSSGPFPFLRRNREDAAEPGEVSGTLPAAAEHVSARPMMFEANKGQFDSSVHFVARGSGYLLGLLDGEAVMSLRGTGAGKESREAQQTVRCRLAGAQKTTPVTGEGPLACRMSYFLGNDSALWRTDVPTYARVKYESVYPGIDLVYYGSQRDLEYDFIVAAGADPSVIALQFPDAKDVTLEAAGNTFCADGYGRTRCRAG